MMWSMLRFSRWSSNSSQQAIPMYLQRGMLCSKPQSKRSISREVSHWSRYSFFTVGTAFSQIFRASGLFLNYFDKTHWSQSEVFQQPNYSTRFLYHSVTSLAVLSSLNPLPLANVNCALLPGVNFYKRFISSSIKHVKSDTPLSLQKIQLHL